MRLTDVIAPSFYDVHTDIKASKHTHYWLKGGRGSTKSSFASLEVILGMMRDPQANAVVLRKVGLTLRESVLEQLQWAIGVLGVSPYWSDKVSPMELRYLPTGQKILFRGADKPRKIKSTKAKHGYFKYIWYEEVDEFTGMEEIRMINQSLLRGGSQFVVFYTYNPPKSQRNWVNDEVTEQRPDRLVHHSTYTTVPKHWLGEQFFIEAEHLQKTKPQNYEHEYMGAVTGTGGEVFTNLTFQQITDEEIQAFDRIRRGVDFGYASDPDHYAVCYLDKTRRRLFIFYEYRKVGGTLEQLAQTILAENKTKQIVTCDSAEPRSIDTLRRLGIRVRGAKKGPDSIEFGIKYLQDLEEIIIDPVRCPNTKREFYGYELEPDGNGGFKANYPDKNNHSIDTIRYALEEDIRGSLYSFK